MREVYRDYVIEVEARPCYRVSITSPEGEVIEESTVYGDVDHYASWTHAVIDRIIKRQEKTNGRR